MKTFPTDKILITLLFWGNDKAQAMKLARLIADLESKHSEEADFLFVPRFDCCPDRETEKYVSRKFNIYSYVSKRRGVGWPMGCTAMFFGAMDFIYHRIAGGKIPHYKAILFLAADSVPLRKGWIAPLRAAWEEVNKQKKTYIAGALTAGGGREHINGDCALLSGDIRFLKWLTLGVRDITVPGGWDWLLASDFKKWGWSNFPFIKTIWRCPTFSQADWEFYSNSGVMWVHGVKDNSLLDLSRKHLIT